MGVYVTTSNIFPFQKVGPERLLFVIEIHAYILEHMTMVELRIPRFARFALRAMLLCYVVWVYAIIGDAVGFLWKGVFCWSDIVAVQQ